MWESKQKEEALRLYGSIEDIPFPIIHPDRGEEDIAVLAEEYIQRCKEMIKHSDDRCSAVHIMGEFSFVFAVVKGLIAEGVECVASSSERIITREGDGRKTTLFSFRRFRTYR